MSDIGYRRSVMWNTGFASVGHQSWIRVSTTTNCGSTQTDGRHANNAPTIQRQQFYTNALFRRPVGRFLHQHMGERKKNRWQPKLLAAGRSLRRRAYTPLRSASYLYFLFRFFQVLCPVAKQTMTSSTVCENRVAPNMGKMIVEFSSAALGRTPFASVGTGGVTLMYVKERCCFGTICLI